MDADMADSEDDGRYHCYRRLVSYSQKDEGRNRQACYGHGDRPQRPIHPIKPRSIPEIAGPGNLVENHEKDAATSTKIQGNEAPSGQTNMSEVQVVSACPARSSTSRTLPSCFCSSSYPAGCLFAHLILGMKSTSRNAAPTAEKPSCIFASMPLPITPCIVQYGRCGAVQALHTQYKERRCGSRKVRQPREICSTLVALYAASFIAAHAARQCILSSVTP